MQHVWLCAANMTTNESINKARYDHFRDEHGNFNNPYSLGTWRDNLRTLFCGEFHQLDLTGEGITPHR